MARTRIKVCGITDIDTALAAAEAGADAIGLVFVESSPRYIAPEEAYDVMMCLPPLVTAIGVFMDVDADAFAEIEQTCPTPLNQFHGSEDLKLVKACGPDIVKAVKFDAGGDLAAFAAELTKWEHCDDVCAVLIDGVNPGSGEPIDWNALTRFTDTLTKPVLLAGGLTPENVATAIRTVRPWGVDVSSGVERERGVKDIDLIEAFCDAVRAADMD
jgi:phosphoribosylanthranilate isomerase